MLVGWYEADSFEQSSGTWRDKSGLKNHAQSSAGAVTQPVVVPFGNGTMRAALQGSSSNMITWPATLLSPAYTLFHIASFVPGRASGRIFTSPFTQACNWLSGFYYGQGSGCAYHQGWIVPAQQSQHHGTNWVLSTDQWAMYRSQGVNRTADAPGGWCSPQMTINGLDVSEGWQVAAVLVYDALLTEAQYVEVEQWLVARYGLGEL